MFPRWQIFHLISRSQMITMMMPISTAYGSTDLNAQCVERFFPIQTFHSTDVSWWQLSHFEDASMTADLPTERCFHDSFCVWRRFHDDLSSHVWRMTAFPVDRYFHNDMCILLQIRKWVWSLSSSRRSGQQGAWHMKTLEELSGIFLHGRTSFFIFCIHQNAAFSSLLAGLTLTSRVSTEFQLSWLFKLRKNHSSRTFFFILQKSNEGGAGRKWQWRAHSGAKVTKGPHTIANSFFTPTHSEAGGERQKQMRTDTRTEYGTGWGPWAVDPEWRLWTGQCWRSFYRAWDKNNRPKPGPGFCVRTADPEKHFI